MAHAGKRASIITTEPAPGWRVTVFRNKELGLRFAPGLDVTPVSFEPAFADSAPAFRYTWVRCALGVLGEATWSYDRDGDPAVEFVRGEIRFKILTHGRGPAPVWWIRGRAHDEFSDPVVALVSAALESWQRRL